MTRRAPAPVRILSVAALFTAAFTILIAFPAQAQQPDANQPPVKPSATLLPQGAAAGPRQRGASPMVDNLEDVSAIRSHKKRAVRGADSGVVSFLPPVTYQPGAPENVYTSGVVAVDMNGDGKLDLVVLNDCSVVNSCPSAAVGVLLGNGDGTFQPAVVTTVGQPVPEFDALAVADVNGDGKPDVILATCCEANGDAEATVLLGNGDGTFQPPVSYDTLLRSDSSPIAVADVNGDGKPDLVAVGWYNSSVSVLLGNGDGTFQPPLIAAIPANPFGLNVADVNNDGKPDLLICNGGSEAVMLGNGDGTFQQPGNLVFPLGGTESAAVADLNRDGFLDIVVPTADFAGVLLGNGNGTFQSEINYDFGDSTDPWAVAVADINGDGLPDVILSGGLYTPGTVGVLLGNGDGTFQPATLFDASAFSPVAIAVGDFNGDGLPDVAMALFNYQAPNLAVILNDTGYPQATNASLTSSPNPSVYGQSVTFTAAITSSSGTPTGTVTFYLSTSVGPKVIGSGTLADGVTSISVSSIPASTNPLNSNPVTAAYQGGFLPSTSAPVTQVVSAATTTTSLASRPNPVHPNKNVTYTATIHSQYGGVANGYVTFMDGGTAVATEDVSGNKSTFTTSYEAKGVHYISAQYSGDSNNDASTSSVLTEDVGAIPYASMTTVATSGSPSQAGQLVTFTATVTSKDGAIPNGGTVTFYANGTEIGTGTTAGGLATCTTSNLSAGGHTIKATYAGNGTFKASSGTVKQIVEK
jgi:hypothetical protein